MSNNILNIIYAGTPEFAVPALQALIDSPHRVVAVYTQPDRRAGRGRQMQASPVKQCALNAGLPVEQPVSLREAEAQAVLANYKADLMVVTAYGLILPEVVLSIPRLGCVNIHASLLPRWRGAAPIQRAIQSGDKETGVTLMQMDKGLDTGDILLQHPVDIHNSMNAAELHDVLANVGANTLLQGLELYKAGRLLHLKQDDALANYADKLSKAEAWLDWRKSATQLARQVRAFNPWPVAQTKLNDKTVRVWQAEVFESPDKVSSQHVPGTVIATSAEGIDVMTGDGILRLLSVQWPGGKALSARDAINAHDLKNTCLTTPA